MFICHGLPMDTRSCCHVGSSEVECVKGREEKPLLLVVELVIESLFKLLNTILSKEEEVWGLHDSSAASG